MVRTIQEFACKHTFAGALNKVGLYRDVLHFYNHDCSLPFVYGISGLFGFSHYSLSNNAGLIENNEQNGDLFPDYRLPPFYTSGNYFFGLNNALRATNVWCQRGAKIDKQEFIELLKTYINEGRPVLVDVEQTTWFALSEMALNTNSGAKLGFVNYENFLRKSTYQIGDYSIICIGYDDEKSVFQMLDSFTSQVITIGFDELYSCTNQHNTDCPPANKWYVFYVPPELPDKKNMVSFSIANTVNLMTNPFKTENSLYFGIEGLEIFSRELKNAYKSLDEDNLDKISSLLLHSSCSVNFRSDFNRFVFSEFLRESAELLNNHKLENVAKSYNNLSERWDEFFSILGSKVHSNGNSMKNAFSILDEIIENEKKAIQLLQESI